MLVFTREIEEEVYITVPPSAEPQTITVKVVKFRRNPTKQVRLGFTAAKAVRINRGEVQAMVDAEATA
jgi:carbon storage regulator CsrA